MNDHHTLEVFLDAIRQSRLLDNSQMTDLLDLQAKHPAPEQLASELLNRGSLTEFQVRQLFQGQGQGLVLGQYVLLDLLGEGGMGQVYKARHQRMKRVVALKVIRTDVAAGPTAIQRFNKEIEAAAQLVHPNVVLAFDANEVDGTLFFVMEYVEGIDLSRLVQQAAPLPVGHCCEYIRQAALGLQHAHERGMVHRDIKPSNLLLTYTDAVVKILDMGLARLQQSVSESAEGNITQTGTVMGTPDFISPEQGRDSRSVDIRSDIYSLGCTLYYLLSGKVPFPEGTFTEKLLKHNMDEAPPLHSWRPDVSDEVAAIVRKMMAKKADGRYQTPGALAEALAPFAIAQKSAEEYRKRRPIVSAAELLATSALDRQLTPFKSKAPSGSNPTESQTLQQGAPRSQARTDEGLPSAAKWETLMPQAKAPTAPAAAPASVPGASVRRSRTSNLVKILVAMLLGVGGAGAIAYVALPKNNGKATGPEVAVLPTTGSPDTRTQPPTSALASLPETRPDTRTKPPDTKKVKPPDPPRVYTGTLLQNIRDEKFSKQPMPAVLSPGGRHALIGWSNQLRIWDLEPTKPLGKARAAASLPDFNDTDFRGDVYCLAINGAGNRVLIGTTCEVPRPPTKLTMPAPALLLWDTDTTNEPRRFLVPSPGTKNNRITCVALSDQGNRALSGSEDLTVRLWDLSSGKEPQVLGKHSDRVTSVAFSPDGKWALSGGRDHRLYLWDLLSDKPGPVRLDESGHGHTNTISSVAFSPDGNWAVSGSYDKLVKLWNLKKRKFEMDLKGHQDPVRCVAFANDSKHFVSGSDDETARLWNVDKVEHLEIYSRHKGSVLAVAFSPDDKYILTISADHTINRWETPPPPTPEK